MSLQLPERPASAPKRLRRLGVLVVLGISLVALAGCSDDTEAERLAMPKPVTEEGHSTLALWQGAWIAALITGAVVWGLILYAVWRFRRRSDDEIPVQTRYNLPLEIFYTIFPVIMVVVFFAHTVRVQNIAVDDDKPVQNTITVVGQQWSWTFNYPYKNGDEAYVFEAGTGDIQPTLYIPVDETTRFNLVSPDVIHDFGVPAFLVKMDVIPGEDNHFQVTPQTTGTYDGKCYELCGVYHSRMLFTVHIVSEADYEAHLDDLAADGNTSDAPVIGGKYADTQAGLEGAPTFKEDK